MICNISSLPRFSVVNCKEKFPIMPMAVSAAGAFGVAFLRKKFLYKFILKLASLLVKVVPGESEPNWWIPAFISLEKLAFVSIFYA